MLAIMKGCSSLGAIVILVIGLAMTGVTIYGYLHPEIFFNQLSDRNLILGILIGADIAIILGSILGMYGIKKGRCCLIGLFQIFVIVFFAVFLGIGIGAELLPNTIFEGNCTTSTNQVVKDANSAFTLSNNFFCNPVTAKCKCGLLNETITNSDYNIAEQALLRALDRAPDGVLRTQDCPNISLITNQTIRDMFVLLGSIQQFLGCSGWCQGQTLSGLIYHFSDVNKGRPYSGLNKYGNIIGIAAFSVSGFLFLMCLCNIFICCHPSRRRLSLRERFIYADQNGYRQVK